MLRHLQLLVFDLDYVIFDCAALKVKALRESLLLFADEIPQDIALPDAADVERGFRNRGRAWPGFLDLGLNPQTLEELAAACRQSEARLVGKGPGALFPGVVELLVRCRQEGAGLVLGAEAGRDYLMAVSDRCGLDSYFDSAYCTEEFGMGGPDEMFEEILLRAEVNASEALVLSTRDDFFEAAHRVDVMAVSCGWGLQNPDALGVADLTAVRLPDVIDAIETADDIMARRFQ